ncbi:hypothetical protein LJB42_001417 [Komagataella kurtzmanii]|nr:hypothetical protein LJB42_001417 [Komagataella kurtzmanii]
MDIENSQTSKVDPGSSPSSFSKQNAAQNADLDDISQTNTSRSSKLHEQEPPLSNGSELGSPPLSSGPTTFYTHSTTAPPKTTRFYKTLADGYRVSDSNSTHHYNPYLYPQHRTRANPPLESINMKGRSTHSSTNPLYPPIPTFTISSQEMENPYKFIESIRAEGEKYGAVRVILENWEHKLNINTELFWFRARRQLLNSHKSEVEARMEFHQSLASFLRENKITISKLPSIDKRSLDLYRLRVCVKLRGGYDTVCQKKLWAQIGRELGYSGKITSSLSSSLKSAYHKVLYGYDLHIAKLEEEQKNVDNKKDKETSPPPVNGSVQNGSSGSRKHETSSTDDPPTKKLKTDESSEDIPIIIGSAIEYKRSRDKLQKLGFPTYFDLMTDNRSGITFDDEQTLATYDFYNWHKGMNVDDVSAYDSKLSPLYNLRQFFDKNLKFQELLFERFKVAFNPTPNDLEKLYWTVVKDKDSSYEVECSVRIPTSIHESGFNKNEKLQNHVKENTNQNGSPPDTHGLWNLNNFFENQNSVLRYLPQFNSISKPTLSIGMMFGTQNWVAEDHYLYLCDYHHIGDTKVWYFIPPKDHLKYEALLKEHLKNNRPSETQPDFQIYQKDFKNSDFVQCTLENKIPTSRNHRRFSHKNAAFQPLLKDQDEKVLYSQDFFLTPEFLKEKGVAVYSCYQEPGEFIFKFPKAYSSTVFLGFSTSESVNFAPPSWLSKGLEAEKWLQEQNVYPLFSMFQLLLSIAKECTDPTILKESLDMYKPLLNKVLKERKEVRQHFPKTNEFINKNASSYITDALENSFPSKIVIIHNNTEISLPLEKALERKDYINALLKQNAVLELHLFEPDESLIQAMGLFATYNQTPLEWYEKLEDKLTASSQPNISILQELYLEGKKVLAIHNNIPEKVKKGFESLESFVLDANDWLDQVRGFLKVSDPISESKDLLVDKNQLTSHSLEEFTLLLARIPNLRFEAKEIDELLQYGKLVEEFEIQFRKLLLDQEQKVSISVIDSLVKKGKQFSVNLPSVDCLEKLIRRKKWYLAAENVSVHTSLSDLQHLVQEGEQILDEHDRALKLEPLTKYFKGSQLYNKELEEFIKLKPIGGYDVDKLKELYDRKDRFSVQSEDLRKFITEKNERKQILDEWLQAVQPKIDQLKNLRKQKQSAEQKLANNIELSEKEKKLLESYKVTGKQNIFLKEFEFGPKIFEGKEIIEKASGLNVNVAFFKEQVKKTQEWASQIQNVLKINKEQLKHRFKQWRNLYLNMYNLDDGQSELFCFCREADSGVMVECDECKEWFHLKCLKMNDNKPGNNEIFVCPFCDLDQSRKSTEEFFLAVEKKPKFEQIRQLDTVSESLIFYPEGFGHFKLLMLEVYKFLQIANRELLLGVEKPRARFLIRKFVSGPFVMEREWEAFGDLIGKRTKEGSKGSVVKQSTLDKNTVAGNAGKVLENGAMPDAGSTENTEEGQGSNGTGSTKIKEEFQNDSFESPIKVENEQS